MTIVCIKAPRFLRGFLKLFIKKEKREVWPLFFFANKNSTLVELIISIYRL